MKTSNFKIVPLLTAVLIVSMFSGCGKSQDESSLASKKPPAVEKESPLGASKILITLKDVKFDVPNVVPDVLKLCESKQKQDPMWCNLSSSGEIVMSDFRYGNLNITAMQRLQNIARASIGENGALVYFTLTGAKEDMIELAGILTEKHGKPLIKEELVQNNLGNKFEKKTFSWIDTHGTQLKVESIGHDNINMGRVTIESASRIAKNNEAKLKSKKDAESNL